MAIVRGNVGGNSGQGANIAWAHNCVSDVAGILLVFTDFTYGNVTAISYNGIPLTAVKTYSSTGGKLILWYLLGPPVGNYTVQCTNGGTQAGCGVSVDYSGVDQANPFGTILGARLSINNSGPASLTRTLTTEDGWMCVDGCNNGRFNNIPLNVVQGAGQTSLGRQAAGGAPNNSGSIEVSEELSTGATTTMSWTGMTGVDFWGQLAAPLRPAVFFATRPIEYTLDAWDPEQRIFDSNGHKVPRYKIKPNNWCRIVGLESTTAIVYDSNYDDPTLVYFESVSYDGETDEVQIVTNRGDLPEVIMARLASGSTG